MRLTDMTLRGFTDKLASAEPTPGGGSASALEGAQGAALGAMVCALTLGKPRYAEHQQLAQEKHTALNSLKDRLMELVERDVEAFEVISQVYAMPRTTQAEKDARKDAMQKALHGGVRPPLETMELCMEGLEHIDALVGKSNVSAASDLGVAAGCLKSAIRSAWLTVVINIDSIEDELFTTHCRSRGEAVLERALPLADEIYERVLRSL